METEFSVHLPYEKIFEVVKTVEDVVNFLCSGDDFEPIEDEEIYETILPAIGSPAYVWADTIGYVKKTKNGSVIITHGEEIVGWLKKSIKKAEEDFHEVFNISGVFAKKVGDTIYISYRICYEKDDRLCAKTYLDEEVNEWYILTWAKRWVTETEVTEIYSRKFSLKL